MHSPYFVHESTNESCILLEFRLFCLVLSGNRSYQKIANFLCIDFQLESLIGKVVLVCTFQ